VNFPLCKACIGSYTFSISRFVCSVQILPCLAIVAAISAIAFIKSTITRKILCSFSCVEVYLLAKSIPFMQGSTLFKLSDAARFRRMSIPCGCYPSPTSPTSGLSLFSKHHLRFTPLTCIGILAITIGLTTVLVIHTGNIFHCCPKTLQQHGTHRHKYWC
jgi:hypothetical protein